MLEEQLLEVKALIKSCYNTEDDVYIIEISQFADLPKFRVFYTFYSLEMTLDTASYMDMTMFNDIIILA